MAKLSFADLNTKWYGLEEALECVTTLPCRRKTKNVDHFRFLKRCRRKFDIRAYKGLQLLPYDDVDILFEEIRLECNDHYIHDKYERVKIYADLGLKMIQVIRESIPNREKEQPYEMKLLKKKCDKYEICFNDQLESLKPGFVMDPLKKARESIAKIVEKNRLKTELEKAKNEKVEQEKAESVETDEVKLDKEKPKEFEIEEENKSEIVSVSQA